MSCRKSWPRSFLAANFTQKFVDKTYKQRREEVLCERALMPDTQAWVELEIELRRVTKMVAAASYEVSRAKRKVDLAEIMSLAELSAKTGVTDEYELTKRRLEIQTDARKKYRMVQEDYNQLKNLQNIVLHRRHARDLPKERRLFVRACPGTDCKGFLSPVWKCGTCEQWSCPDCHELKGPAQDSPHTCNPDNVETAKLLARDTRPCPKCATMIFKISGCDQMWCTQCQTAFSWRTGNIETHVIHNPHYYEYMRNHGGMPRQPGDVQCGGLPFWQEFMETLRHEMAKREIPVDTACIHRSITHAQNYLMHVYMPLNRLDASNRERRIKYMMNELTEDKFKKEIQKEEKSNQRQRDIRSVIDMYVAVGTDLFQQVMRTKNLVEFYNQFEELRNYTNESMRGVSRTYSKCVIPTINCDFNWTR
jgi:hypothetical protein